MNHQSYSDIFTASSAMPSASEETLIVSPGLETNSLLDSIYAATVEEIGSNKFMKTYCTNLERLSIQAHLTAGVISASQSNLVGTASSIASPGMDELFSSLGGSAHEEYIVEAFLENADKLEDLIKTLLALEYWRDNVLFRKHEGIKVESEKDDEVEFEIEGGERGVLDAYDSLNDVDGGEEADNSGATKGLASLLATNGNTLRGAFVLHSENLCENSSDLPASIVSRMLEVHDWPLLMVPLIEEPPWTRRRQVEQKVDNIATTKIVWEKFNDNNEWSEVFPKDLLVLTKAEAQPWLALFHLTTSKVCRESYGLDEFRKAQLMRLRRYIHDALTDQLPVLQEVARYLDELSILGVPVVGGGVHRPSSNASSSGLLLQRVDSLREIVIGHKNIHDDDHLDSIVKLQWDEIFSHVTDSTDIELKRVALEVYDGPGSDGDEFGEYSH